MAVAKRPKTSPGSRAASQLAEGVAAELDVEGRRSRGDPDVLDRLDLGVGEPEAGFREVDDRVGDLAVARHLGLARAGGGRAERRGHLAITGSRDTLASIASIWTRCDATEPPRDWKTISSTSPEPPWTVESSAKAWVEFVPGSVNVLEKAEPDGVGGRVDPDDEDDPGAEDPPATTDAQAGEGLHSGTLLMGAGGRTIGSCGTARPTLGDARCRTLRGRATVSGGTSFPSASPRSPRSPAGAPAPWAGLSEPARRGLALATVVKRLEDAGRVGSSPADRSS